ncbi:MAG TPA: glycosyltransferase family 2 protein [Clostridiales bacterium]|nr:glycosyltransferase family 2 protein [Clostridiales bacterium]
MSTVAIVMAAYNGEKYIREQVDSILASSYQDFELFIFDDGSKDRTLPILKEYELQYPDKIHLHQNAGNLGLVSNFLQGVCKTTMDYVMFCDQDDVWKPNKIAITLKRMRNMEAQTGKAVPMVVFTDAVMVDQDLKVISNSFFCSSHLNPCRTDLPHMLMENKLIGCTVMINAALRKVLQSSHLPNNARYHDWWVGLIGASMGRISFVREGTLLYRQHGGNVVGGQGFADYVKKRITALGSQREALRALGRQADEFIAIYQEEIPEEKREIIRSFADLGRLGYIKRRQVILRYKFFKTGLVRNIGLMIII